MIKREDIQVIETTDEVTGDVTVKAALAFTCMKHLSGTSVTAANIDVVNIAKEEAVSNIQNHIHEDIIRRLLDIRNLVLQMPTHTNADKLTTIQTIRVLIKELEE